MATEAEPKKVFTLEYSHSESGFCREYYKFRNGVAKGFLMTCFQQEYNGHVPVLYDCQNDMHEPSHEIKMPHGTTLIGGNDGEICTLAKEAFEKGHYSREAVTDA